MSGYGYGPPPPPPAASGGYSHPRGSYSQGQSRGGSQGGRGRGQYPRGRDHRGPQQPHYDYAQQQYQGQPPYGALPPQPAGGYVHHWSPDQRHGPHAPAPLSAANYHPNYVPQPYPMQQQPQAYGPHQPYPQPYPAQSAPHSWPAHGSPPGSFSGHRGGRGGHDRGNKHAGHSRPNHHQQDAPPPVAAGSFSQPYPQEPRAMQYPPAQFPYSLPPPPPAAARHDHHHRGQNQRRGRGGGHRDHNARGRGGHGGHNARTGGPNSGHKNRQQKPNNQGEGKPKMDAPSAGKKKKRKVNTLGLTPGVDDSETEDDEGEEKALTDLIGAETLQISDVAAFLAERRNNFPTKARVEAKKAAETARKDEDKTAELEKQAEKLRRQLRKVEVSIKRKREQGDEGDEMRDPDESSDDDKPEVQSSRKPARAANATTEKKADITRHCKYYSTGGTCGKKGKCRFVHDPKVREAAMKEREANNGRLTIQQRLLLNDKEQEDLAVLQSIQYLRQKGLMETVDEEENHEPKAEAETGATEPKDETAVPVAEPEPQAEPESAMDTEPVAEVAAAAPVADGTESEATETAAAA